MPYMGIGVSGPTLRSEQMEDSTQEPVVRASCPFLGRRADLDTAFSYPTHQNVCHAEETKTRSFLIFTTKKPYRHVSTTRQKETCLVPDGWKSCPRCLGAQKAK